MKLKVVIVDLETPGWLKKTLAVCLPVLAVATSGIVLATPKNFADGTKLSAADLNAMNSITFNSVKISVGATHYCGDGFMQTTGNISFNGKTGYAGAKALCEASVNCGMSPTAHMCDASEIVRSAQLGQFTSPGWYLTASDAAAAGSTGTINDCNGWASNASTDFAAWWDVVPGKLACNNMSGVLCCD